MLRSLIAPITIPKYALAYSLTIRHYISWSFTLTGRKNEKGELCVRYLHFARAHTKRMRRQEEEEEEKKMNNTERQQINANKTNIAYR